MKPRHIAWFVGLQCLSLAIAPVKLALDWSRMVSQGPTSSILVFLCTTVILVLLIWKTTKRKNWARISLLVFFLMGALPFALIFESELARSTAVAVLSVLQAILQASSIAILFTGPANQWFRRIGEETTRS